MHRFFYQSGSCSDGIDTPSLRPPRSLPLSINTCLLHSSYEIRPSILVNTKVWVGPSKVAALLGWNLSKHMGPRGSHLSHRILGEALNEGKQIWVQLHTLHLPCHLVSLTKLLFSLSSSEIPWVCNGFLTQWGASLVAHNDHICLPSLTPLIFNCFLQ